MKNLRKVSLYLLALLAFGFASCESEDPEKENDGEVITDVTLKFQELNASNALVGSVFSFKASDPQGIEVGKTPTIQSITLAKGKKYQMTSEVTNSIENAVTGDSFSTDITLISNSDLKTFSKKNGWAFDWNDEFIIMLQENEYVGQSDEEIVNKWFNDVCRTVLFQERADLDFGLQEQRTDVENVSKPKRKRTPKTEQPD